MNSYQRALAGVANLTDARRWAVLAFMRQLPHDVRDQVARGTLHVVMDDADNCFLVRHRRIDTLLISSLLLGATFAVSFAYGLLLLCMM